ncbi:hypothetical protein GCM10023349_16690 [Nocardioides conyzicola]|uniref:Uncharacterized protein n=1 Tax=Nocardioides conyzicola TaxID=1651781 RepID=A0ABP8X682_9ACTN
MHELGEEAEDGPLDRHPVEDAGEALGVHLCQDVVGRPQLVGPWVHGRDPSEVPGAGCNARL